MYPLELAVDKSARSPAASNNLIVSRQGKLAEHAA